MSTHQSNQKEAKQSDLEKAFVLLQQYNDDDRNVDEPAVLAMGKLLLMVYKEFKSMITSLNNAQHLQMLAISGLENRILRLEQKQKAEENKRARDRNNNNTLNLD